MKAFQKWLLMTPMIIGVSCAYALGGPDEGMGQKQATTACASVGVKNAHQEAMRKDPTILTKAQMDGITAGTSVVGANQAAAPAHNNNTTNPSNTPFCCPSGSKGLSIAIPR